MNTVSLPKKFSYLLLAGLLVIALALFLGQFTKLPDFARGSLMGVGIGLEIIAVSKLAAHNKKARTTGNQ